MNGNTHQNSELNYYIIQSEEKYILNVKILNEVMTLSIKDENNFNLKYSTKLELKDIIKKNKLFKMYDSIDEFKDSIKILVDKKLITIKEDLEKNICVLEMIFSDSLFKENKIFLELSPEETNKDELINNLISIFKNLDKKVKNLEIENKSLKEKSQEFQNQINEIKNTLNSIQKNNEEKSLKNMMDFPSKILTDKKELELLIYPISSREKRKIKNFKKLYCASIDGESASDFHRNCDDKLKTVVLIKTPDNRRFGGYTQVNWKSGDNHDKNTFLFSLDLLKIYPRKENGYSILFYSNTGPVFGGNKEIDIGDKCISTKSFSIKNESKNFDFLGIKSPLCDLKNDEKIQLIDYEVYQVIFE